MSNSFQFPLVKGRQTTLSNNESACFAKKSLNSLSFERDFFNLREQVTCNRVEDFFLETTCFKPVCEKLDLLSYGTLKAQSYLL